MQYKKTKEGELPTVDIDDKAGQLPEYDVDWAAVNISTGTKTIKASKVVIVMEEEDVKVPYIDMPDTDEKEERTITIETEVTDKEYSL